MLKILHTADWHLGKKLQEFPRIEEQKLVLEEICEIAESENIDLVMLAGDIFDSFNPNHEAVELLYKTLKRLSNHGKRLIIAISGNHDSTQFVEAPDPLARELGIVFYSKYDSIVRPGPVGDGIEITKSEEGFIEVRFPHLDFPVRVIMAPYANEVLLKTFLGDGDKEESLRQVLEDKWQKLADSHCDSQGVNLFMGHFFFIREGEKPEPEPESERPILHVGGAQALYTKNIPAQIQYAALGHLHRYHAVQKDPFPVVYSSSPLAYSFSEADQDKRVVLIEAQPGKDVDHRPITLKQGKPLYRKRFEDLQATLEWLEENPYCFVELTYVTEESIDAQTRKAIMQAHEGIVNLIPHLKAGFGSANGELQAEDLNEDMETLFIKYFQSQKSMEPNEELLTLFREITSQTPSE
ncbi:exonuclease subunit SbcD [Litoribacter alkaliphilus]|uniref:Nuclease SbcCD subunit D n=1 Tax=Litoribacter ruber TaxID=702568 RepID=A0AAP2CGN5_9BACT|nr:exonuclease subunit SbcD [Litoribacter alkaliphilus]MBS9524298.1 exonuclease subunit SbcD [Litoribacter alkaliphilus]